MGVVISNDVFLQKRMKKEYEILFKKYRDYPYPQLSNQAIYKISTFKNVKAIVSHIERSGTVNNFQLVGSEIFHRLSDIEFDYEFVCNSILKIFISNTVLVTIYFNDDLPEPVLDDLIELLEIDIIANYRIVDTNMAELRELYDKIYDLGKVYMSKFNEPICDEE